MRKYTGLLLLLFMVSLVCAGPECIPSSVMCSFLQSTSIAQARTRLGVVGTNGAIFNGLTNDGITRMNGAVTGAGITNLILSLSSTDAIANTNGMGTNTFFFLNTIFTNNGVKTTISSNRITAGTVTVDGGTLILTNSAQAVFRQLTASRFVVTDGGSQLNDGAVSTTLRDTLTDETGTGSAVFSASPTFTGTAGFTSISVAKTNDHGLWRISTNISGAYMISNTVTLKVFIFDAATGGLTVEGVITAADPAGGTQDVVTSDYADNRFARQNQSVSFTDVTLANVPNGSLVGAGTGGVLVATNINPTFATAADSFGVAVTNDSTQTMMVTVNTKIAITALNGGGIGGGNIDFKRSASGAPTTVLTHLFSLDSTATTGDAVGTNACAFTFMVPAHGSYVVNTNLIAGTVVFSFQNNTIRDLLP